MKHKPKPKSIPPRETVAARVHRACDERQGRTVCGVIIRRRTKLKAKPGDLPCFSCLRRGR